MRSSYCESRSPHESEAASTSRPSGRPASALSERPARAPGSFFTDDSLLSIGSRLERRGLNVAFCGIHGTGKTTLAHQLADALRRAGIEVRIAHSYRWYQSYFITPWSMIANRYLNRKLVVHDRCFVDNLARLLARLGDGFRTRKMVLYLARLLPTFDCVIHLQASWEEILQRGRCFSEADYTRLSKSYQSFIEHFNIHQFNSDDRLLSKTCRTLTGMFEDTESRSEGHKG